MNEISSSYRNNYYRNKKCQFCGHIGIIVNPDYLSGESDKEYLCENCGRVFTSWENIMQKKEILRQKHKDLVLLEKLVNEQSKLKVISEEKKKLEKRQTVKHHFWSRDKRH